MALNAIDWDVVKQLGNGMFLMAHAYDGTRVYAPLYIHQFRFAQNSKQLTAGIFLEENLELEDLDNVPDKLKWCRYKNGLMQKEVADHAGIYRSTYSSYEKVGRDYFPIDIMKKFAELFRIDVTALLDEYNLFIYNNQGEQIKNCRRKRGMTQAEYAEFLNVSVGTLKEWETNRTIMGKKSWEKWVELG